MYKLLYEFREKVRNNSLSYYIIFHFLRYFPMILISSDWLLAEGYGFFYIFGKLTFSNLIKKLNTYYIADYLLALIFIFTIFSLFISLLLIISYSKLYNRINYNIINILDKKIFFKKENDFLNIQKDRNLEKLTLKDELLVSNNNNSIVDNSKPLSILEKIMKFFYFFSFNFMEKFSFYADLENYLNLNFLFIYYVFFYFWNYLVEIIFVYGANIQCEYFSKEISKSGI